MAHPGRYPPFFDNFSDNGFAESQTAAHAGQSYRPGIRDLISQRPAPRRSCSIQSNWLGCVGNQFRANMEHPKKGRVTTLVPKIAESAKRPKERRKPKSVDGQIVSAHDRPPFMAVFIPGNEGGAIPTAQGIDAAQRRGPCDRPASISFQITRPAANGRACPTSDTLPSCPNNGGMVR